MQHGPSFSFPIVRCLRNSDFFSSSGLVALGMQGTQNVTLGYLCLSGEFKYNLWEFGELRPRRSSSGFLYDVKHPSGHRGRLPLGGKAWI